MKHTRMDARVQAKTDGAPAFEASAAKVQPSTSDTGESAPTRPSQDASDGPTSDPDPFDPARYRLSQDFAAGLGVKRVLTTVPVRKPYRQEFVRVRPGETWRLETALLEDTVNRETFLVEPRLVPELTDDVTATVLFTAISRQQAVFLWPVKLPRPDGRSNRWNDSALAAARLAEDRWVRVAADMAAGHYATFEAVAELCEPEWPQESFADLLGLAFRGRVVDDISHPVLRRLRGEL